MNTVDFIKGYKDSINKSDFIDFLNIVSKDFMPPLIQRISNIDDYYDKINNNATFIICKDIEQIVGMIVFYCNDYDQQSSYVTLLAIKSQYRRRGIASYLLQFACEHSKKHKKVKILIDTNNEYAKKCYLKCDFQVINSTEDEKTGLIRYYMEKKL